MGGRFKVSGQASGWLQQQDGEFVSEVLRDEELAADVFERWLQTAAGAWDRLEFRFDGPVLLFEVILEGRSDGDALARVRGAVSGFVNEVGGRPVKVDFSVESFRFPFEREEG